MEGLLSLSDEKVRAMLENYADGQEESRRLIAALKHLQAYTGTNIYMIVQLIEENVKQYNPVKMFLSSRQDGWSSRQQKRPHICYY